jgi:hypothetical protein
MISYNFMFYGLPFLKVSGKLYASLQSGKYLKCLLDSHGQGKSLKLHYDPLLINMLYRIDAS